MVPPRRDVRDERARTDPRSPGTVGVPRPIPHVRLARVSAPPARLFRISRYPGRLMTNASWPSTIGDLRASGYADRSVKDELRDNLLAKLSRNEPLFPSIIGFEESVLPALERGLLAGHDLTLLGERGQAKPRLIRHLAELQDEETTMIPGCEDD